ncbi:YybH family protein [Cystobacter fuscus]
MGFQGSSKASDSCCDTSSPALTAELSRSEERAILRAVQGYAEGFIREDMRFLLNLWDDRSPDGVSYIAAELDEPLTTSAELRSYYQSFLDTLIVYSGDISSPRIFLRGDMAYVFCQFNWVYRVRAGGRSWRNPLAPPSCCASGVGGGSISTSTSPSRSITKPPLLRAWWERLSSRGHAESGEGVRPGARTVACGVENGRLGVH